MPEGWMQRKKGQAAQIKPYNFLPSNASLEEVRVFCRSVHPIELHCAQPQEGEQQHWADPWDYKKYVNSILEPTLTSTISRILISKTQVSHPQRSKTRYSSAILLPSHSTVKNHSIKIYTPATNQQHLRPILELHLTKPRPDFKPQNHMSPICYFDLNSLIPFLLTKSVPPATDPFIHFNTSDQTSMRKDCAQHDLHN